MLNTGKTSPFRWHSVRLCSIAVIFIVCGALSFLATHALYHQPAVARPVAHETVFHRKAAADLRVGGSRVLGATAYQPYVLFYDSFEGLNTATEGNPSGGLFAQDSNWRSTGTTADFLIATANRDAQSSEMALGGNQYPVSSTVSPAQYGPGQQDIAPGGPSAFLGALQAQNGGCCTTTGQVGMYQIQSQSWASHPLAISFSADWGHDGNTTALLMTPDDNITATNSLTTYANEPDYLALVSTGDGNLHLQERQAGGTVTDLVPAFPILHLNDEQRDYRVIITGTSTTAANVNVQQYQGMDQRMEGGYMTFPNDWVTLATTSMTYPSGWNSHVHLWMNTTSALAGFGRVAEVDPTALPTYNTPTILSYGGIDPSVNITYTTPGASDPSVVGYVARWYHNGTYINQKYTMWAGQGVIQANGIDPSLTYTMTVSPVYVGGYVGPASPAMTTTSQPNTLYRQQFNGFFDDFTGVTETNSMALDPALYDLSQSYIDPNSSPGFVMSRHWMENIRLADNFTGARGGDAQRIRTPFDITNRTGTFQTEVDLHAYGRNWWDLDFVPTFITSNRLPDFFHENCCSFPSIQPNDYFQLTFVGSGVNGHFVVHWRKNGNTAGGSNGLYGKTVSPAFSGVPDLRNLLVVKLSASQFQLYLDGKLFWTVPINIVNGAYYVSINHVPYHTDIEGDVQRSEFHYANVGFDAPTGTTEPTFIPVYAPGCAPGQEPTDGCNGLQFSDYTGDSANINPGMARTFTMNVPVAATTATAATFEAVASDYDCNGSQASVSINGHAPVPLTVLTGSNACGHGFDHTTVVGTVPLSYFVPATNTVQIIKNYDTTNAFAMGNEQVEFDTGGTPLGYNAALAQPLTAASAATNTVQQVNLSSSDNELDIASNGTTFASSGFDGTASYRSAYSAQDMASKGFAPGTVAAIQGVSYTIPISTGNNGVGLGAGPTIPVSATAAATTLNIMGAAGNGSQRGNVTITYTDGTTDTSQLLAYADWCSSYGGNPISSPILRVTGADGTNSSGSCSIYTTSLALQPKPVRSVTFPANGNLHVLAMSLSGRGTLQSNAGAAANTVAQVLLTSLYNEADIVAPGTTFTTGGFDGTASYRSAYSSSALGGYGYTTGGTGAYNNVVYAIPAAGISSGVAATGQTITVTTPATGTALNFVGAAAGGYQAGPVTINYADGTSDASQVLGFPDWCSGGPHAPSAISAPIMRVAGTDGSTNSGACDLYAESLPLQNKAVTSVTLPNNSPMHIVAMSVSGAAAPTPAPTATAAPLATATPVPPTATPAAASVPVTITAGTVLAVVPSTGYGMNDAVWDSHATDAAANSAMQQLDMGIMRMPGGSTADDYHWANNTVDNGPNYPGHQVSTTSNPAGTPYYTLAQAALNAGMQPLMTFNYGTNATLNGPNTSTDDANWVQDANVTRKLGIKYWEQGNENFGGGYYDYSYFESNLHDNRTPQQYATDLITNAVAMQKVDPSILIGASLEVPGYYPWGAGSSSYPTGGNAGGGAVLANPGVGPTGQDWNTTVISDACANIGFIDAHWYPINQTTGTDADLLGSVHGYDPASQNKGGATPSSFQGPAGMMAELKNELQTYCPSRASQIKIFVGESNSNEDSPQRVSIVDGLFAADEFPTWLENGASNASWWDMHNGPNNNHAAPAGVLVNGNYSDLGVLSAGSGTEPAANTPFPSWYGLRLDALMAAPGDSLVQATSPITQLVVHAARRGDGSLGVLLLNEDPTNSHTAALNIAGFTPAGTATTYSYGATQAASANYASGIVTGTTTAVQGMNVTVPAYTMETLSLQPVGGASTPTPTPTTPPAPSNQVPLSGVYNFPGIVADGTTFTSANSLDGCCSNLSTNALATAGYAGNSTLTYGGNVYNTGPTTGNDVVRMAGQTINLGGQMTGTALSIIGFGVTGTQTGTVTVQYTNGTTGSFPLGLPDWIQGITTTEVLQSAYRDTTSGTTDPNNKPILFNEQLGPLTAGISSITLPTNNNMYMLAASVIPTTSSATATSTPLPATATSTAPTLPTSTATSTATPVALVTPAGGVEATIDDSVQGTATNQFNYAGTGWGHCTNCDPAPSIGMYNGSNSYDHVAGDTLSVNFVGTGVVFSVVKSPTDGYADFSVDGGVATRVDTSNPTRQGNVAVYSTGTLAQGAHTLTVKVDGIVGANGSTDSYVASDSVMIYGVATLPTATSTPAPTETALPAPSGISPTILGLHASGSQLLNGQGQPVVLHGVNRDGSEYMCAASNLIFDGPNDAASVQAMANWTTTISGTTTTAHLTGVRIPFNEDCLLGINGLPMGGTTPTQYLQALVNYAVLAQQNGLVPIFSLQAIAPGTNVADGSGSAYSGANTMPMPDADHSATALALLAGAVKNNTGVMIDVFNEFHPDNNSDSTAAWTCIRDGGTCNGVPYTAVGTQALVSAVRNAGFTGPLLLGGTQFASHLDQWTAYRPSDPQNNLIASWHLYDNQGCTQTCWDQQVAGVGASAPIVAGEIGETDCGHSAFLDPMMAYDDSKGISYFPWAWDTYNCSSFPALITNYSGAATQTYGQGYHDHLLALAAQPTSTPVATVTPVNTPLATATSSAAATNTPILTAIPTNTATNTRVPTATNTPAPTATSTTTATAGPPTTTQTATATPTVTKTPGPTQTPAPLPVVVGQTNAVVVSPGAIQLSTSITAAMDLHNAVVEFDVASLATGARVYSASVPTYLLSAGAPQRITGAFWRVPPGQPAGTYRVSIVVYAARYLAILGRDTIGATVTIGGANATPTATSPASTPLATATPGGPTNTPQPTTPALVSASAVVGGQLRPAGYALIAVSLTDAVAIRGPIVQVMIRDTAGRLVYQPPAFTVYALAPHVTQTVGVSVWRIPAGQAAGTYSVTVAVYAAGYLQVLLPETTVATLAVSAPLGGSQRDRRRAPPAYPRSTPASALRPTPYSVA